jgi:hypothetical protein
MRLWKLKNPLLFPRHKPQVLRQLRLFELIHRVFVLFESFFGAFQKLRIINLCKLNEPSPQIGYFAALKLQGILQTLFEFLSDSGRLLFLGFYPNNTKLKSAPER